jgi:SAM-dependent methyltransferase
MAYTFGDHQEASRRLHRLAEIYEPETRSMLLRARERAGADGFQLAFDLGCGPGWTTRLLASVLQPRRTVGLEFSERYLEEARRNHPALEFFRQDIQQSPFPPGKPDLLFCRFLLTHLSQPVETLRLWAGIAAPGAMLLVHETESIASDHPVLQRYYDLLDQMQQHHGQNLNIGAELEASFAGTGWRVLESRCLMVEKQAGEMAELHLPNLRTWGRNEYAAQAFNRMELENLEAALEEIAANGSHPGTVFNAARQMIVRKD